MTGPVERVPLTDEQLDEWDGLVGSVNRRLEAVPGMPGEWHVMDGVHRCATTHGLHSAAEDAAFFAKAAPLVARLLAELRASRAREQEALFDAEDMRQHFLTANAAAQKNARQMWAARAEREDLQQRIDKALTECDGLAKIIQSFTSDADARSTAGGASVAIAAVRAVLTGMEAIRSVADPGRALD